MRLDYESLTPDASRHLFAISAAIRRSVLDPILRELTAVLVSQLNGCAHCIAVHWEKALRAGASERQLRLLTTAEEAGDAVFAERTLVALRLARALTISPHDGISDELWAAAQHALGDESLMWLVQHVMLMNSWNRLSIALRIPPPE
mgnify:CR=1 FL=1